MGRVIVCIEELGTSRERYASNGFSVGDRFPTFRCMAMSSRQANEYSMERSFERVCRLLLLLLSTPALPNPSIYIQQITAPTGHGNRKEKAGRNDAQRCGQAETRERQPPRRSLITNEFIIANESGQPSGTVREVGGTVRSAENTAKTASVSFPLIAHRIRQ